MKKSLSKIISLSFVLCAAALSTPLSAQVKTSFTKETRPTDFEPTGMVSSEGKGTQNKTNVQIPDQTRGIERFQKKNVFGQDIPDSFLFYRSSPEIKCIANGCVYVSPYSQIPLSVSRL